MDTNNLFELQQVLMAFSVTMALEVMRFNANMWFKGSKEWSVFSYSLGLVLSNDMKRITLVKLQAKILDGKGVR